MTDFLVDASPPRSTAELIRALGHQAADVRDIGLGAAPDPASRKLVLAMTEQFLRETAVVEHRAGHLAVVEPGRYRLRPA